MRIFWQFWSKCWLIRILRFNLFFGWLCSCGCSKRHRRKWLASIRASLALGRTRFASFQGNGTSSPNRCPSWNFPSRSISYGLLLSWLHRLLSFLFYLLSSTSYRLPEQTRCSSIFTIIPRTQHPRHLQGEVFFWAGTVFQRWKVWSFRHRIIRQGWRRLRGWVIL